MKLNFWLFRKKTITIKERDFCKPIINKFSHIIDLVRDAEKMERINEKEVAEAIWKSIAEKAKMNAEHRLRQENFMKSLREKR